MSNSSPSRESGIKALLRGVDLLEKQAQMPAPTKSFFQRDGVHVCTERGREKNPNPETAAFAGWLRKYKP